MGTSFEAKLGTFLDRIAKANDLGEIRTVFHRTISEMGFRHFTYHFVKIAGVGNHLPYVVTTYPEHWVERYKSKNYVHIDPLITLGPRRMIPFLWDEVAAPSLLDRKQKKLYDEAATLGIAGGLSIPIHGRNGEFAMMSVVPESDLGEAGLSECRHQVHLLAMYYHNCISSVLLEHFLKSGKQREILTEREKECLKWSAMGKSTAEIGDILGIARTTVVYYIENAKRKLDVFNKTHAVVRAMTLNLISLD